MQLLDQLRLVIEEFTFPDNVLSGYKQAMLSLQELIMSRYDDGTMKMLKVGNHPIETAFVKNYGDINVKMLIVYIN